MYNRYDKLLVEKRDGNMKKKIILIGLSIMVLTGCASNEKANDIGGKSTFNEIHSSILDIIKEQVKTTDQEKDEQENVSDEKSNEQESKQDDSQKTTTQALGNNGSNNSGSQSSVKTDGDKSSSSGQSQQDNPKQDTQPQKPTAPVIPKPSTPTCDDTIPSGAYPIELENEVCSEIEAEISKNLSEGKPTYTQYEIEYGVTECGTKYFYIIPIY